MGYFTVNTLTNEVVEWAPNDQPVPQENEAVFFFEGEVLPDLNLDGQPDDRATLRWDGATGMRLATVAELSVGLPRLFHEVLADVQALTTQQKTNVKDYLTAGTPKKIYTSSGARSASIATMDFVARRFTTELTAAELREAQEMMAAMWIMDNVHDFEAPVWDPTINISGLYRLP